MCVCLSVSLSSFLFRSHALPFFLYYYPFHFLSLSLSFYSSLPLLYLSLCYRNKGSSQTPIEAETDVARSKDRKMQMTVNNEIKSIEKSITNLDLARDKQIR